MKSIIKVAAAVLVLAIGFSAASCRRDEQRAGNAGSIADTDGGAALTAQAAAQAEPAAPVLAQAEPAAPVIVECPATDFRYGLTADGRGIRITGYVGRGGDVVIPAVIEDMPVLAIGREAFMSNNNIRSIVVPDSVEVIGRAAFMWAWALTQVRLPDNITVIPEAAFMSSPRLTSINLPANLEEVHDQAFAFTPLTELIIPDTLTTVRFPASPSRGINAAFDGAFDRLPIRTRQAIRSLGYTGPLGL